MQQQLNEANEAFKVLKDKIVSSANAESVPEAEYVIVKFIAGGSYGSVYRCLQRSTKKYCVAKFVENYDISEAAQREMFVREVFCMGRMNHFACVKMIDAFEQSADSAEHGRSLVIIAEEMDAGTLQNQLDGMRQGCLPPWDARTVSSVFVQVLLGLHHMHKNCCLHRDLKPENILLNKNGAVKISDYGLSRGYKPDTNLQDPATTYCGTALYLSPERWQKGPYGAAADIWSFGVILYNLMELGHPFATGDVEEIRDATLNSEAAEMTSTDQDEQMKRLVRCMLTKDPRRRPGTAELMRDQYARSQILLFKQALCITETVTAEYVKTTVRQIDEALEDVDSQAAEVSGSSLLKSIDECGRTTVSGRVHRLHQDQWQLTFLVLSEWQFDFYNEQNGSPSHNPLDLSAMKFIQPAWPPNTFCLVCEDSAQSVILNSDCMAQWLREINDFITRVPRSPQE